MITSLNTLVIDSLEAEAKQDSYQFFRVFAKINARIDFRCPITGNTFKTIHLVSENKGDSVDVALLKCIEDFFNKKSYDTGIDIHDVEIECFADHKNIHAVDYSNLEEPFYSMFKDLFDKSKWKEIIELPESL